MCGIAGIVAADSSRYAGAVDSALRAIRHRGPDGEGVHRFPRCVLGAVRLAIVDLESGAQPMLSPEGTTAVVFNGAIYGYRDLRRELVSSYPFRTASDTEVLLALHRLHGRGLLERLPGMFAFAIWDEPTRTLFAARDRFGEKPLYWARGPAGELLFASEVRAILATGLVRPEVDRTSLAHYLQRRFVPPGRTIWRNVEALPPAHSLTFRDGTVEVSRYWDLPAAAEPLSVDAAVDEFRGRFESAVQRQLVADVPVAFFLSGGLDSSTVVAVASRFRTGIRTITFDSAGSSDLPHARAVARRYGTDHVEIADRGIDLAAHFEAVADAFDEPLADPAVVGTWLVCRAAREHAKVILTGEGGDELLAGYTLWYRAMLEMERWCSRPAALTAMAAFAERLARRIPGSAGRLRGPFAGASAAWRYRSVAAAHLAHRVVFNAATLQALGLPVPPIEPVSDLDGALRDDVRTVLPGDWLVRTDRASMAHGIELRSPFLDTAFASFCVSLPVRLKLSGDTDKWILRRAYAEAWPESVRLRSKQGFQPNQREWMERPEVKAMTRRFFEDRTHALWSLLPYEPVRIATAGRGAPRTLTILMLALWAERWMREARSISASSA